MTVPVRPRGCGCLMLFSIFCLIAFTAAEVGLLVRLDPDWFDRQAFWRGPIVPPDMVPAADTHDQSAPAREDGGREANGGAGAPHVFSLSVEVDYDPAKGATLRTKEGGVFEFPAGSIGEALRIRAQAIGSLPSRYRDPHLAVAGPSYQLSFGDQEHYDFLKPVKAVLRYVPALLAKKDDPKNVTIYVWGAKGWEAVRSVVDEAAHTVSAEISHASPVLVAEPVDDADSAGRTPITAPGAAVVAADGPLDKADPFQGVWEGQVELVEGELVGPILKAMDAAGADLDRQRQKEIAAIPDPEEKARAQKDWDDAKQAGKKAYDAAADIMRAFELLARLGVPMKMRIRRTEANYSLSVVEILGLQTDAGPQAGAPPPPNGDAKGGDAPKEWTLTRIGPNTLRFPDPPEDMPAMKALGPPELRLHRIKDDGRNEIRGDYELEFSPEGGKTEHCKFKWNFTRISPQAP